MRITHLAFCAILLSAPAVGAIPQASSVSEVGQNQSRSSPLRGSPSESKAPPAQVRAETFAASDDGRFICMLRAFQDAIRWPRKSGKTVSGKHVTEVPAWSQEKGEKIGSAFIAAGRRHGFRPGFLVSFAVNESDLKENAVRETRTKDGRVAKDSGLMAVRCILSTEKRWWKDDRVLRSQEPGANFRWACTNAPVRGMTIDEILEPERNIEIAAAELARLRDKGVPLLTTRIEKVHGKPKLVREVYNCPHKNHPAWAHYNWGTRTIETGPARHYPHRVAVLAHAIAEAMDTDAPELVGIRFVQDKGSKPRRVDKPVGERQRRLFGLILSCQGHCERFALR
jgi:hypothetical protein